MKVFIIFMIVCFITLSDATLKTLKSGRSRSRTVIQPINSYKTVSYLKSEIPQYIPLVPAVYPQPVSVLSTQVPSFRTPLPSYVVPLASVRAPIPPPKVHVASYTVPASVPAAIPHVISLPRVVPNYVNHYSSYIEPFTSENIPVYEKPLLKEHFSGYGHTYTKQYAW